MIKIKMNCLQNLCNSTRWSTLQRQIKQNLPENFAWFFFAPPNVYPSFAKRHAAAAGSRYNNICSTMFNIISAGSFVPSSLTRSAVILRAICTSPSPRWGEIFRLRRTRALWTNTSNNNNNACNLTWQNMGPHSALGLSVNLSEKSLVKSGKRFDVKGKSWFGQHHLVASSWNSQVFLFFIFWTSLQELTSARTWQLPKDKLGVKLFGDEIGNWLRRQLCGGNWNAAIMDVVSRVDDCESGVLMLQHRMGCSHLWQARNRTHVCSFGDIRRLGDSSIWQIVDVWIFQMDRNIKKISGIDGGHNLTIL